jgi:hypothetical protein
MIRFDYLIRGGWMVKCTKKQIRQLKTALRWKIPAAQRERIHGAAAREWDDAAGDCGSDGRFVEHREPRPHGL